MLKSSLEYCDITGNTNFYLSVNDGDYQYYLNLNDCPVHLKMNASIYIFLDTKMISSVDDLTKEQITALLSFENDQDFIAYFLTLCPCPCPPETSDQSGEAALAEVYGDSYITKLKSIFDDIALLTKHSSVKSQSELDDLNDVLALIDHIIYSDYVVDEVCPHCHDTYPTIDVVIDNDGYWCPSCGLLLLDLDDDAYISDLPTDDDIPPCMRKDRLLQEQAVLYSMICSTRNTVVNGMAMPDNFE